MITRKSLKKPCNLHKKLYRCCFFGSLVHFPGSKIYKKDELRLIDKKWWLREDIAIDFQPKLMNGQTLEQGILWSYNKYYSNDYSVSDSEKARKLCGKSSLP